MKVFSILGNATLSVTTSTGSAALDANAHEVMLYNAGTALCFIRMGGSDVVATTSDTPIPSGAIVSFHCKNQTHIAAITASGTATLYVTSGVGV